MAPSSRPETVLKQAEGLVSVGQTHAALQSLTEMFSSKKFRSTPLASLEPIMHRFVELCVEMRKGRTAKEGLMQYKNIAQNTSVQSIESVITRFVELSDKKVREAQEKAAIKVALDVDDLEASETPESILLGAVSGDQSKDRTDRALVTPWLKFLWESYRTSLETLKNNARLEAIYQQIAQQAFKFCLKYQRKVEFRRLCETLRLHLANVAKYSHQTHSINLSDADTLQHHLDTRFAQLNASVELELWQEAFRSVEDVHNLLTMAKKAPRPAMMANYYEKLTKIFLMSGNALYHAAAWGRYYAVVTSIGGKTPEEMSRLAGQVLVSALAVPVGLQVEEEVKGKSARLSALIGLTKVPTRSGLLKDALSRDVLRLAPESIKSLYNILEVTFDPLSLCSSISPLFQSLLEDTSYAPYLPLLQRALLSRLLSQLSQVYSTIKISQLHDLINPLKEFSVGPTFDEVQVEAYVMGCARRGELAIRVDHAAGSISFVDDAFGSSEEASTSASASTSTWESRVQPSTSELVRTRLSSIATCLHNSLLVIEPPSPPPSKEEQQEKVAHLVAAAQTERKALQVRRALVARRRELLSELSVRKEKEESSRKAEVARKAKEEEDRRTREEVRRRERERTQREIETIRADEAKKLAMAMVERGQLKGVDVDNMENLDQENLISIQVAQIEKEKKELNERLRVVSKRLDHMERAYRKDERPLLAQDYERQQKHDREAFITIQQTIKEEAKRGHEENVATKARLSRMMEDFRQRRDALLAKKNEEFARKKEAAQRDKIDEEKAKRLKAVSLQWEEEKKKLEEEERIRKEKEEEEARIAAERREEEERRLAAEEEARAAAEAAKREEEEKRAALRKAREEERAKLDEQARLQRKREEEAEARRANRQAEKAAPPARKPIFGSRENGNDDSGGGVWRRSTPVNTAPPTPTRASANGPPPRSESPAPGPGAPRKYTPGAFRAAREAGNPLPHLGVLPLLPPVVRVPRLLPPPRQMTTASKQLRRRFIGLGNCADELLQLDCTIFHDAIYVMLSINF
ncbi:hypothetical protein ONZ45_g7124 [Pleurotus djamor]|nr:hypothetical protein ONZ45_g7124 [Pleurotus djamor]